MAPKLNRLRFLERCFSAGSVMLTDGHMGDGKTFAAVSLAYEYMHGHKGHPVYLVTNVAFKHRTPSGIVRKDPPGVFYAASMESVLRVASDLMLKHGFGNFTLIWILDEAQNFMSAESHLSAVTQDIYGIMGNIRKFCMSAWMLTPVAKNLGPRMRTGPVLGDSNGYLTTIWKKDMPAVRNYLIAHRIDGNNAKRFTTVRWKPDMAPHVVFVPSVPWTTPLSELPVGGYAYDTGSLATFSMGSSGFSLSDFLAAVSSGDDVALAMRDYFSRSAESPPEPEKDPLEDMCLRADRMRSLGLTWKQISSVEDRKYSTIRGQYQDFFARNPSLKCSTASRIADSGRVLSTRAQSKVEGVLTTENALEESPPLSPLSETEGCGP